jgi:regulator of protease activity HflC (stomatin/prohibitin superfamily)
MSVANDNGEQVESTANSRRIGARRWVLIVGGLVCLASWIALGLGIVMEVSRGTLFVLATLAAVATEGLFWLAAAVLGVTVFQARRRVWNWVSRHRGAFDLRR